MRSRSAASPRCCPIVLRATRVGVSRNPAAVPEQYKPIILSPPDRILALRVSAQSSRITMKCRSLKCPCVLSLHSRPTTGGFVFDAQTHGRNRLFFPSATHVTHRKPRIVNGFLLREKHQYFPRKIAPTMCFWTLKICSISAGKAGISQVPENILRSVGYRKDAL